MIDFEVLDRDSKQGRISKHKSTHVWWSDRLIALHRHGKWIGLEIYPNCRGNIVIISRRNEYISFIKETKSVDKANEWLTGAIVGGFSTAEKC